MCGAREVDTEILKATISAARKELDEVEKTIQEVEK